MSSPSSSLVRLTHSLLTSHAHLAISSITVGEDEEVSIKEVADAIVKALDFKGDYTVRLHVVFSISPFIFLST